MKINIGNVQLKKKIYIGNVRIGVKKIFPELEDLEIIPSTIEQNFKSNKYGYNNVKVKAVESEELNITPNTEEQVKEGMFNKVTVAGDSNLIPSNIREGTSLFGVEGTMAGTWDSSQITSCREIFEYNKEMINAPYFDTSNAKDMSYMFQYCESLETVPTYNTSIVENLSYMFQNCQKLISANFDDTSKVTNMSYMFQYCDNLTSVSLKDTSKVTRMDAMFAYCVSLKNAPELNTSNVRNFSTAFTRCSKLETMPMYDASKFVNIFDVVSNAHLLTSMGGLLNLGKAYTKKTKNDMNYKLNISASTKLTHDSLMNVINGLYDLNLTYDVANGGTLYTQQLVLGSTNLAKLTAEEIAICTAKGWSVS